MTRCFHQRPLMNFIRKQSVSSAKGGLTPSAPTALPSNNNGNNNGVDHHNNDVPSPQLLFVCCRHVMEEAAMEEELSSYSLTSCRPKCLLCLGKEKVYSTSRVSNITGWMMQLMESHKDLACRLALLAPPTPKPKRKSMSLAEECRGPNLHWPFNASSFVQMHSLDL